MSTLLDYILGNYEEGSAERAFAKIIKEDYVQKFDALEFDKSFEGVAGYKPCKTFATNIAEDYLGSFDTLDDKDREMAIDKFAKAYDEVANLRTLNIQGIIDGIVDDIVDDEEIDDDDDECCTCDDYDEFYSDDDDSDDEE